MPIVRAEVPVGGLTGASARSKMPILLVLAWALCWAILNEPQALGPAACG